MMSKITNAISLAFLYILNKLPLRVLYFISDLLFPVFYYVVGYRRKVVRKNLHNCFPEKSEKELLAIEKDFYHRFCDYFVETIKFYGMSEKEVVKHIDFKGLDEVRRMLAEGRSCVCYMGHVFNWEFVVSLPVFMRDQADVAIGAVYHRLRNPRFDKLCNDMRAQYGADNVDMKKTLRHIVNLQKNNKKFIFGFISDQLPKMEAMNHWLTFMNQDTPVFTGAEKIAVRTKSSVFYVNMVREKRGRYVADFILMAEDATVLPEFELTNDFFRRIEDDIRKDPASWLWTHKRWKRTRADQERYKERVTNHRRALAEEAAKKNAE